MWKRRKKLNQWIQKKLKTIGMSSLIKIFVFSIITNFSYSQIGKYPSVMYLNNDTLVCFTTSQSKQMALWNEERKECIELSKIDNQKINELEKIINSQGIIIYNLEEEITKHKENISDKDALIKLCEDEKKTFKKEIRKQKLSKWISIIGGVALSVFCLTI
jgi:vacuolar-type H+-ATPase subunit I/STV1